jgi:hypothetical protein
MAVVHRFDTVDAPAWMTEAFTKTPEGYLKGKACVTSIGVFPYLMADGTVVRELRLPDDVFAEDSLESYKLKPVTNDHPDEKVTAENVKQYQVGNLGENPMNRDNVFLTIDMIIQDATAIADIMAGKRALSVGYDAEIENSPGVFGGMAYDCIQRKIRANHVAVVDRARQGDQARIRLDSADAVLINSNDKIEEETMAEPTNVVVKVDASEVQSLIKAEKDRADGLQTSLDALTAEKAKIEAERDTHKDRADKAEAKVKELEKARADEAAKAKKIGVGIADSMDNVAIQKAVILKAFPKANLDGKDQVYIDARFDGAVEQLESELNADAETRKLNADSVDKTDTKDAPNAEKARQAYIDRLTKKVKE